MSSHDCRRTAQLASLPCPPTRKAFGFPLIIPHYAIRDNPFFTNLSQLLKARKSGGKEVDEIGGYWTNKKDNENALSIPVGATLTSGKKVLYRP